MYASFFGAVVNKNIDVSICKIITKKCTEYNVILSV